MMALPSGAKEHTLLGSLGLFCINPSDSYTEHTIKVTGKPVLDFFHNEEKHIRYGEFTTDLFGEKTIEILETVEKPKFIYLAFNAPHEPAMAPEDLIEEMRKLHPEALDTRLEHLASIYHMDLEIEKIVKSSIARGHHF